MARSRVRAAAQKREDEEAHDIGSGVYSVARDLGDRQRLRLVDLAFPRPVSAPLIYLSELSAGAICRKRGWDRARADDLAQYILHGLQEALRALVTTLDEEHFEAWMAAARARIDG